MVVVLTPPQLYDTFLTLKNSQQVYDGSGNKTNIYQNTFDIVVNTWQASTDNDWYIINENATVPAFILQRREEPSWELIDYKDKRNLMYMSTARLNAGYGNFTSIIKIDNS